MSTKWEKINQVETVKITDTIGKEIVGVLDEVKSVKTMFRGKERDTMIYSFHSPDNVEAKFKVFGTGLLDHLLRDIKPGTPVKIVYKGKKTVGANDVHQFDVFKGA